MTSRLNRDGTNATPFDGLDIKGISLHCYNYAWAVRTKTRGYPERFAQVNRGHNSNAMTRAYSRKTPVQMPAFNEYKKQ
jgi:hypothetical protein